MADVLPFYFSWLASCVLMIDRKVGKTSSVLLCGVMCYLEYTGRVSYGDESMQTYFDKFSTFFPNTWTMGE